MFLHLNESQHNIPLDVVDNIIQNVDNIRYYCELPRYDYVYRLRDIIADKFDVARDNVLLGNGSNEIILAIVNWARKRYNEIITFSPNYESVFKYARNADIPVKKINLADNNWKSDLTLLQSLIQPSSIVYISNPNNPTGELIDSKILVDLISHYKDTLFLIDEAYLEYCDDPGVLSYDKVANCIVVKTFSKFYQLAGLRIGYCIGPRQLLNEIKDYLQVDDLNLIAVISAIKTLQLETHSDHYQQIKTATDVTRRLVEQTLQQHGIPFVHGSANFVFCYIDDNLYHHLLQNDIIISRQFVGNWRRITIGNPQYCDKLINVINQFYELNS